MMAVAFLPQESEPSAETLPLAVLLEADGRTTLCAGGRCGGRPHLHVEFGIVLKSSNARAPRTATGLGPRVLAPDDGVGPLEHGAHARHEQLRCPRIIHPAELVMLGPAEYRADR